MFNELSNFILHCVTVYTTVPRRGGGGGNIGGYSDLRKHIKTRENCYPLIREIIIYTQNSTFQRGTNQQKLNIEMNLIFFNRKKGDIWQVYILSKCMRLFITFIVILQLISSLLFTSLSDTKL